MNVLFDHQVFSFQEYGGISRYYSRLLKIFSQNASIQADLIVKFSNNAYLHEVGNFNPTPFFGKYRFKGRNEIIRVLNQLYFKKEYAKRPPPDIFHPTYYHQYFLNDIGAVPFVLTIYDMAHEIYPGSFHPFDFTIKNKKALAKKAARIIAISEYTKKDIVRILEIPESSIDVIPLATDIVVNASMMLSFPPPKEFILYVGARNTYKNFMFFLRSMKSIMKDSHNLFVICAGGGTFSLQEQKNIEQLGLSKNIRQINVSDESLALLYSKAKAFVYPSLYEGFGIPIVEAFTCGAPVILSNRSSLPEVGGEAAAYFEPDNNESLEIVVRSILNNPETRNEMVQKGFERAKMFSWNNTAEKTIETYKKVLQHR
ncbi:MAG: glycosyltransferase family 1 protein [Bacteroidota bacterium]